MTPADLRAWRKRLGMTQAQAAEALGRSRNWVQLAEVGKRPIERVVELACAYLEETMPCVAEGDLSDMITSVTPTATPVLDAVMSKKITG